MEFQNGGVEMRNFGAVLPNSEFQDAITAITCTADTAKAIDRSSDLLPKGRVPTKKKKGYGYGFNKDTGRWGKVFYKLGESLNDGTWGTSYVIPGRTTGWQTYISDALGGGSVGATRLDKICSWYVWYFYRENKVHSDLKPFYSGNVNSPTISKIIDAEKKWAEQARQDLIFKLFLRRTRTSLDTQRDNFQKYVGQGMMPAEALELATQEAKEQANITSRKDYAEALEAVGTYGSTGGENSEEKDPETRSRVIPVVAGLSLGALTFAGLYFWGSRE